MEPVSHDDLKVLLEEEAEPQVSIYMPIYLAGKQAQQNKIRYKNMLKEASAMLDESGMKKSDVRDLLEPAQELSLDSVEWHPQTESLAMFVAPGFFRYYTLSIHCNEILVVADSFHKKPLLRLLGDERQFLVLAVSQNEVRLLQGSSNSIEQVELEGLPKSFEQVIEGDDVQRDLLQRSEGTKSRGRRSSIYYGGGEDYPKEYLLSYFRQIDAGLRQFLKGKDMPLILAGVQYFHAIYREANTYKHFMEEGIWGSPDRTSALELHNAAMELLKPQYDEELEKAVGKYHQLMGTGKASNGMAEVIAAAYAGKIETLFVAEEEQVWGSFDVERSTVDVVEEAGYGERDLLDLAAEMTLLARGKIYTLDAERMPDGSSIAAVYRY